MATSRGRGHSVMLFRWTFLYRLPSMFHIIWSFPNSELVSRVYYVRAQVEIRPPKKLMSIRCEEGLKGDHQGES